MVGLTSYSIINGVDCGVIVDLFGGCLLLWLNVNWTRGYAGATSKASIGLFKEKQQLQNSIQFSVSVLHPT